MVDSTEAMESQYLTADIVKESNTKKLLVVTEGNYEETDYGNRLTMGVCIDGKNKTWRPNRDSVKNLSRAYGKDTKDWVDKAATLQVISIQGKDSIIATPTIADSKPQVEKVENSGGNIIEG